MSHWPLETISSYQVDIWFHPIELSYIYYSLFIKNICYSSSTWYSSHYMKTAFPFQASYLSKLGIPSCYNISLSSCSSFEQHTPSPFFLITLKVWHPRLYKLWGIAYTVDSDMGLSLPTSVEDTYDNVA